MTDTTAVATKPCRFCGEDIKASASICRFCNREQAEPQAERVLYDGAGHLPIQKIVMDLLLILVCIGIPMLIIDLIRHKSRKYRITTQQIVMNSGIISKRTDVLDLFRVQDLQFQSSWGFGSIVITSSDRTTPRLVLPIPNAQSVFDQLRPAVAAARKGANVMVQEHV